MGAVYADHTERGADDLDTIAAIATPPGAGGISIVRISGAGAFAVGMRLFRAAERARRDALPPSHVLT